MNIHSIYTLQGLQNAIRPAGEEKSAPSRGTLPKVAPLNSDTFPENSAIPVEQSPEVSTLTNNREKDLESDPTVVHYPPFFPIATYQRLDLITKTKEMEDTLQDSLQDESIGSRISDNFSKDKVTDTEISTASGEIFAFRDQLTGSEQLSLDKRQPGSILDIEV